MLPAISGKSCALALVLLSACGVPGRELFLPETTLHRADAIVVLGNRPPRDERGQVAPETARRVRRGVELFEEGVAPVLVVTGGPAPGGGTEAEVMAALARELGVPDASIVREPRARDTAENAGNTVALLCGDRDACSPSVIVVSSPYHLRRALRLFECAGARAQAAPTELEGDIGYRARFSALEYGVRLAYVFDDACARSATAARR